MTEMNAVPRLSELLEHPERVSLLPPEAIPVMRGKLAELDTLLQACLHSLGAAA